MNFNFVSWSRLNTFTFCNNFILQSAFQCHDTFFVFVSGKKIFASFLVRFALFTHLFHVLFLLFALIVAEKLRHSPHVKTLAWSDLIEQTRLVLGDAPNEDEAELLALMRRASKQAPVAAR